MLYCVQRLRGGGCGASKPPDEKTIAETEWANHVMHQKARQRVPELDQKARHTLSSLDNSFAAALGRADVLLINADLLRVAEKCGKYNFRERGLPCRQILFGLGPSELPGDFDSAFIEPHQAVKLLRNGKREIGGLTYGWARRGCPTPTAPTFGPCRPR